MAEWNLTVLKARDYGLFYISVLFQQRKRRKKRRTLTNIWVNLWLGIIVSMTKPAWWWAGKRIYKAHKDLKYVHKRATSSAPTQSLPWWTHTQKCTRKHMSTHKKQPPTPEPGSSLDHAPHPHPLSKKPEVNSFPYSLSLSHPAPSHTLTAPITASGANSCQTLNFQPNALISIFP